jgi:hypothetical protein
MSLSRGAARKFEFVRLHIDSPAAEVNALGFQSQPLFESRIATQLNFSTGA